MPVPFNHNRRLLAAYIRANCGPVTITTEDMLRALGGESWWDESGLDPHYSAGVLRAAIQRSADDTLAKALGIGQPEGAPDIVADDNAMYALRETFDWLWLKLNGEGHHESAKHVEQLRASVCEAIFK